MLGAIASKGVMVARDRVVIWVWVLTSGIWGITLEGHIVGAGSAWHWCSIATAWVIGGFTVIAGHRARWSCHLWVPCDFADVGFTDGGVHVWGWRVVVLEQRVDDHSSGKLLLISCSHC